jgi:hypothetical protein
MTNGLGEKCKKVWPLCIAAGFYPVKKWAGKSSAFSGLDDGTVVSRSRGRFRGDCGVYPQSESLNGRYVLCSSSRSEVCGCSVAVETFPMPRAQSQERCGPMDLGRRTAGGGCPHIGWTLRCRAILA